MKKLYTPNDRFKQIAVLITGFLFAALLPARSFAGTPINGSNANAIHKKNIPNAVQQIAAVSDSLQSLSTTDGTASASTYFRVTGSNLQNPIVVTPPPGFEVSLDNSAFTGTVSVGTSGTVPSTKIYLRLSAADASGFYSGNFVLSSSPAASVNVAMLNSSVSPAATKLIYSSNHAGNSAIAVVGDVVSLDFVTTDPIIGSQVTIGVNSVTATNVSGNEWLATYTMTAADPIGRVNFTVSFTDGHKLTSPTYTDLAAGDDIEFINTDALLKALGLSAGSLSPAFAQGTNTYAATVKSSTLTVTITPTTDDPTAGVSVNGTDASVPVKLSVGDNVIPIVVTAADGTTQNTYTVTITRPSNDATLSAFTLSNGTLSPAFLSTKTSYKTLVGNGQNKMTITPTADNANATITVNGTAVISGQPSQILPLTQGTNTITTVVTAQDGTTKTYTLVITEARSANDNLFSIKTSSGLALGETVATTLTESVPFAISSISVTPTTADPTATMTVNNTATTSGQSFGPIALDVGTTIISTVVTAQTGVTKTYTLTVTRRPDVTLSGLQLSQGALNTPFSSGRTKYSSNVGYAVAVSVTPTLSDPAASLTINGVASNSGATFPLTELAPGRNAVNIIVTGTDGTTTATYTVTVNQARSQNDGLFSFKTSAGLAKGKTVPTTLSEDVPDAIDSIAITPTLDDTTASVTVNGVAVTSGMASANIGLATGENTITTIVTAQSGVTKTYTLTVNRAAPASLNAVYQPVGVTKTTEVLQLAEDGIVVHASLSPNGDGINDFLQIEGIANYPENKLAVMNRNGQLVYEVKGYDNSMKAFDGHSNKNGQMQLPGTYFYSLDYTVNGTVKHKTGFLVLKY